MGFQGGPSSSSEENQAERRNGPRAQSEEGGKRLIVNELMDWARGERQMNAEYQKEKCNGSGEITARAQPITRTRKLNMLRKIMPKQKEAFERRAVQTSTGEGGDGKWGRHEPTGETKSTEEQDEEKETDKEEETQQIEEEESEGLMEEIIAGGQSKFHDYGEEGLSEESESEENLEILQDLRNPSSKEDSETEEEDMAGDSTPPDKRINTEEVITDLRFLWSQEKGECNQDGQVCTKLFNLSTDKGGQSVCVNGFCANDCCLSVVLPLTNAIQKEEGGRVVVRSLELGEGGGGRGEEEDREVAKLVSDQEEERNVEGVKKINMKTVDNEQVKGKMNKGVSGKGKNSIQAEESSPGRKGSRRSEMTAEEFLKETMGLTLIRKGDDIGIKQTERREEGAGKDPKETEGVVTERHGGRRSRRGRTVTQ